MDVVVLGQKFDTYSMRRLVSVLEARQHSVRQISPITSSLKIGGNAPEIMAAGSRVMRADAVLLRCATYSSFGVTVVRAFETALGVQLKLQGAICINDPEAKQRAHNKFLTLQMLANAGIAVPPTFLTWEVTALETVIENEMGLPVILKMNEGTWGIGVTRADSLPSARSMFETIQSMERIILAQKYIEEAQQQDIRAFVIGGEVVAAMRRVARPGEFRSNIHQGAQAQKVELPEAFVAAALGAARVLDLEVAGVDLLESANGPLVLEVNPAPGLEQIEATTGVDIATLLVEYIEKEKQRRG